VFAIKRTVLALVGALMLAGCARPDPPLGPCPTNARLPHPPPPTRRSIPIIIAWANTAVSVANVAIAERDQCAASYSKLKEWVR